MSENQVLSNRLVSNIGEIENAISNGALAKDRAMEEYILQRLQYFKYRYSFLNLPIREADHYEINALRKKLTGGRITQKQTKKSQEAKAPTKITVSDQGFQVTYKKTGAIYHYTNCILAKITYQQNKQLLERLKEYPDSDPNEKKFYIFKEWIPDLKEHAIYSDDENVLAEIAEFILATLGGEVRKVE